MRRELLRVFALETALALVLALPVVGGFSHRAGASRPRSSTSAAVGGLSGWLPPERHPIASSRSAAASVTLPGGERPQPALLVHARRGMIVRRHPDADARALGVMPASSKYYHVPLVVWIEEVSDNGRWGRIEIPYRWPRRTGWILLAGLRRETTWIAVEADLSDHRITIERRGHRVFSMRAATGAPATPTPAGDYFVTDRVPFTAGSSYGSFAFGISGIQPHLPVGWTGGNQLALHGTNAPGSIGRSVSAGCLRVNGTALHRLLPLLRLGTPFVIHP